MHSLRPPRSARRHEYGSDRPATRRRSRAASSGVTARSECGAMPTCVPGRVGGNGARALDQTQKPVGIVEEAALARLPAARRRSRRRRRTTASSVRPMPVSALAAAMRDRHLAEVVVGPAVGIVVEIVELADRGEAGFQHLHVGERRDRLDVVGREPLEEAVHHLAPGPEAVGRRTAAFAQARPCRAGTRGNADSGDPAPQCRRCARRRSCARAGRNRGDDTVGDRDADIARPAGGKQGMIEEQIARNGSSLAASGRGRIRYGTIGIAVERCIER